MRYHPIPHTSYQVSAICLGTGPVGTAVAENEAFRLFDQFVDAGGNFFDTARAYAIWVPDGEGISETILGRWLKTRPDRNRILVATKGGHPPLDNMQAARLTEADLRHDLEASLRALQVEAIPIYWLHRDDPHQSVATILDTLERFRAQGLIHSYGCSNWRTDRMRAAETYARRHNLPGFIANQPLWSFAAPNPEAIPDSTSYAMDHAMYRWHQSSGLPVIPYTSQAHGFYSRWAAEGWEGLPASLRTAYGNDVNASRFERLRLASQASGLSIGALALAWLMAEPSFPTIPIIWTHNSTRLSEILSVADQVLPFDLEDALGARP
jgi:aryl-alcohol dehydrogenase-like predicted oxidoreductase